MYSPFSLTCEGIKIKMYYPDETAERFFFCFLIQKGIETLIKTYFTEVWVALREQTKDGRHQGISDRGK